ncbi:hypothetical protein BgiMline_019281 [Biomphalaria glabrata]|nr:hypothetical protein BgiMline_032153 [Biomphalaria glabrata]
MEFMYCIPDLELFIDKTIKKCLLEYDLDANDTEAVLDDMEKAWPRTPPRDSEKDAVKDCNDNTEVSRRRSQASPPGGSGMSPSGSGLPDTAQRAASGKKPQSKVAPEAAGPDAPSNDTSMARPEDGAEKVIGSTNGKRVCDIGGVESDRSNSSSPDVTDGKVSTNKHTKLKSRLQQRYFEASQQTQVVSAPSPVEPASQSMTLAHDAGYRPSNLDILASAVNLHTRREEENRLNALRSQEKQLTQSAELGNGRKDTGFGSAADNKTRQGDSVTNDSLIVQQERPLPTNSLYTHLLHSNRVFTAGPYAQPDRLDRRLTNENNTPVSPAEISDRGVSADAPHQFSLPSSNVVISHRDRPMERHPSISDSERYRHSNSSLHETIVLRRDINDTFVSGRHDIAQRYQSDIPRHQQDSPHQEGKNIAQRHQAEVPRHDIIRHNAQGQQHDNPRHDLRDIGQRHQSDIIREEIRDSIERHQVDVPRFSMFSNAVSSLHMADIPRSFPHPFHDHGSRIARIIAEELQKDEDCPHRPNSSGQSVQRIDPDEPKHITNIHPSVSDWSMLNSSSKEDKTNDIVRERRINGPVREDRSHNSVREDKANNYVYLTPSSIQPQMSRTGNSLDLAHSVNNYLVKNSHIVNHQIPADNQPQDLSLKSRGDNITQGASSEKRHLTSLLMSSASPSHGPLTRGYFSSPNSPHITQALSQEPTPQRKSASPTVNTAGQPPHRAAVNPSNLQRNVLSASHTFRTASNLPNSSRTSAHYGHAAQTNFNPVDPQLLRDMRRSDTVHRWSEARQSEVNKKRGNHLQ